MNLRCVCVSVLVLHWSAAESHAANNVYIRQSGSTRYQISSESATWSVSRDRCASWGGHLIEIDSPSEQGFISGMLRSMTADYSDETIAEWWIGLNDRGTEGTFVWQGTNRALYIGTDYDNFSKPREPNGGTRENCVEIRRNFGRGSYFHWNDESCQTLARYICERDGHTHFG